MPEKRPNANGQTVLPPTNSEIKPTKSRRAIYVAVAVLFIVIVVISAVALSSMRVPSSGSKGGLSSGNDSGSSSSGDSLGKGGVTMVDLQMDYNAWKGDFKSYNEKDTVVLRDTITSIELGYNPFDKPITTLYFRAHPLPSLRDLESGRVQNESWYTWRPETWEHAGVSSTIFPIKYDANSAKYLPEAGIGVQGDVRDKFNVGDTVKITLHIWKPSVESIYEFKWTVAPEKVQKVS